MRSEKAKMLAGDLYVAQDPVLIADRVRASAWMERYNGSLSPDDEQRTMLEELLASLGDGTIVRPPFYCDYGYNIALGRDVFLNFGCIMLDAVEISIGDLTQIGPGVQILTADHPRAGVHSSCPGSRSAITRSSVPEPW